MTTAPANSYLAGDWRERAEKNLVKELFSLPNGKKPIGMAFTFSYMHTHTQYTQL